MRLHSKRSPLGKDPIGARPMAGFTMTELMIVLAIVSIIAAMAAPSFNRSIDDNRNLTATNTLVGSLNLARSEAVRRANTVTVCPSSNGTSCGTSWADGWIVFADNAMSGTPQVNTVLQTMQATQNNTFTRTVGANNWVRFTSRGGAEQAVTFEVKPTTCTTGINYRRVRILASGRTQADRLSCT